MDCSTRLSTLAELKKQCFVKDMDLDKVLHKQMKPTFVPSVSECGLSNKFVVVVVVVVAAAVATVIVVVLLHIIYIIAHIRTYAHTILYTLLNI